MIYLAMAYAFVGLIFALTYCFGEGKLPLGMCIVAGLLWPLAVVISLSMLMQRTPLIWAIVITGTTGATAFLFRGDLDLPSWFWPAFSGGCAASWLAAIGHILARFTDKVKQ